MYKGGLPSNLGSFIPDDNYSLEGKRQFFKEGLYDPNKLPYCVSRNVTFDVTNHHLNILKKNNSLTVFNGTLGENGKPKEIYSNISEKSIIMNTTFNALKF